VFVYNRDTNNCITRPVERVFALYLFRKEISMAGNTNYISDLSFLNVYGSSYLDDDTLSRILSEVLRERGIPHKVLIGSILRKENDKKREFLLGPHVWIKLDDGRVVDFCVRMWLGDDILLPHGVFDPNDYDDVFGYVGAQDAEFEPLPEGLFSIMEEWARSP
jgi:hypothetical protein